LRTLAFERAIQILIVLLLFCAIPISAAQHTNYDSKQTNKRVWFGLKGEAGFGGHFTLGSNMFDGVYSYCDNAEGTFGGSLMGGLMLHVWITDNMALATELNYRWLAANGSINSRTDMIEVKIRDHAVEVPVLLRFGDRSDGFHFEVGVVGSTSFKSDAHIYNKSLGIDDKYSDSDFRAKRDIGVIIGLSGVGIKNFGGVRLTMPAIISGNYDKHGGIKTPAIISFFVGMPIFRL